MIDVDVNIIVVPTWLYHDGITLLFVHVFNDCSDLPQGISSAFSCKMSFTLMGLQTRMLDHTSLYWLKLYL